MPIMKKLKMLLLFNPLVEWIDQTHLFRLWLHDKTVKAGMSEVLHFSRLDLKLVDRKGRRYPDVSSANPVFY
jgi:phosphatidylserine decarboxylase